MNWESFSYGKNVDSVELHKTFLRAGATLAEQRKSIEIRYGRECIPYTVRHAERDIKLQRAHYFATTAQNWEGVPRGFYQNQYLETMLESYKEKEKYPLKYKKRYDSSHRYLWFRDTVYNYVYSNFYIRGQEDGTLTAYQLGEDRIVFRLGEYLHSSSSSSSDIVDLTGEDSGGGSGGGHKKRRIDPIDLTHL